MKTRTRQSLISILLGFALCMSASADIWRWVDANGETHFVNTNTPIYTWVDESGKVYFSDKPEHETAVLVDLIWHSDGYLEDMEEGRSESGSGHAIPGETQADRDEREQAEAYYCKRAQEVYDSYVNAPALYKTTEDGKREYLTKEEMATTLAETEARVAELCD